MYQNRWKTTRSKRTGTFLIGVYKKYLQNLKYSVKKVPDFHLTLVGLRMYGQTLLVQRNKIVPKKPISYFLLSFFIIL